MQSSSSNQSNNNKNELQCLLAQSHHIYKLAVDGEWEKVIALESERRSRMGKYFSSQAALEDPQMASQLIQEIIDLDNKIIALGADAQKKLGNALADLQRGRQATQAYKKVGS